MPQPYPHGELVVVIDCSDLDRSARFWSGVLGYTAGPDVTGPYHSLQRPSTRAPAHVLICCTSPIDHIRHRATPAATTTM